MAKRMKSEVFNDGQIFDLTDEEQQTEVIRGLRDVRPSHYVFKIKNYSLLYINNYESTDFEVAGYKWKLSLYPKGVHVNENDKHISLYLVLSESNSFTLHQEVNVYFKLFIYNQLLDKYLTVQDAKGRLSRFRGTKTKFGFDHFLPLSDFNDASNGYLIDDCCIFGAEIFVVQPISKGECASVVEDLSNNAYTWNVQNFAKLNQECCSSEVFVIGGYKWTLTLYPNGVTKEKGKSMSLFLKLEDHPGRALYAEFVLRIKDQLHRKHTEKSTLHHFPTAGCDWGFASFIPLSKLNNASNGYLINGAIVLEVQISFVTKVEEEFS